MIHTEQEIQRIFEEFGLGTKGERERLLQLQQLGGREQDESLEEPPLVTLSDRTSEGDLLPEEGMRHANVARDLA